MEENKSLKLSFDVVGGDFERAGEASAKIKKMLKMIGVPADIVRRIAIGTYEAEMNVIIHAGGGNVRRKLSLMRQLLLLAIKAPAFLILKRHCKKVGLLLLTMYAKWVLVQVWACPIW